MYKFIIIGLLFILLQSVACGPRNRSNDVLKKLQSNNMDFLDWDSRTFHNIGYSLPEEFQYNYSDYYVINEDNARVNIIRPLKLYFSVEIFSASDADEIAYQFEETVDRLDAVHEHYVYKREQSLGNEYQVETSVKKALGKISKFPGWFQVVHGKTGVYTKRMTYFTATIEVGDEYYVFQWIGKEENMTYLLDDFNKMITTIS